MERVEGCSNLKMQNGERVARIQRHKGPKWRGLRIARIQERKMKRGEDCSNSKTQNGERVEV
jgi:hypothetical protein